MTGIAAGFGVCFKRSSFSLLSLSSSASAILCFISRFSWRSSSRLLLYSSSFFFSFDFSAFFKASFSRPAFNVSLCFSVHLFFFGGSATVSFFSMASVLVNERSDMIINEDDPLVYDLQDLAEIQSHMSGAFAESKLMTLALACATRTLPGVKEHLAHEVRREGIRSDNMAKCLLEQGGIVRRGTVEEQEAEIDRLYPQPSFAPVLPEPEPVFDKEVELPQLPPTTISPVQLHYKIRHKRQRENPEQLE